MDGRSVPAGGRFKAITLDLDDTLWPVVPTLVAAEAVLAAWLERQAPRSLAHYGADRRKGLRAAVLSEHPDRAHDMSFLRQEMIRRALLAGGEDEALAAPAFAAFLEARQQVRLFEDVKAVLGRWASRYPLLALTNGNADIGRVGLAPYFVGAVSAEEVGHPKPDPRIFEAACQRLGLRPDQVLHIGDDPELDGLGAKRAGLQAAIVRHPSLSRSPASALAEAAGIPMFSSLSALDTCLHPG